ncbi:hypothetical protein SEA_ODESZA_87 [Gordonia Phage Odesza]|uniref:Uncharacterized protein n=4 Tax=Tanisvirus tanis TaxID=2844677 RepID=A0A7D5FSH6_9CAUD|nr:hypothetical protein PBI_GRAVY_88 [Gordonia phage Gravy]AVO25420.1 hypothetical protein PBI_KERRY_88 [Gordonia phage Kerry]QGJ89695.1 hypothetical protein SEA_ODESZA_87 [Gordonia Phage Odesza]QKY78756.1 hypothetical protein SEA_GILL_89 [Gordonia phage Gill]QLF83804.1 hypothetical protein SEA_MAGEL_90 [Gordonia phage Magel]QYW00725.1 hypothetical protein SEA_RONEY_87 [Gordonia phage Roney]
MPNLTAKSAKNGENLKSLPNRYQILGSFGPCEEKVET